MHSTWESIRSLWRRWGAGGLLFVSGERVGGLSGKLAVHPLGKRKT
jgi:hypothetical protein